MSHLKITLDKITYRHYNGKYMFYLRDTRKHNTLKHRVITNKTYKMTEIDKKLVKNLPFGEIMELINAKHLLFHRLH